MNGRIPLFDLGRQWPAIRDDAVAAFERIASAGAFSLGEELASFESEFAEYCGGSHCVGVANGTVAIELALRALGAGPGRDVVTVAHTFVATVEAIAATGARPLLVDVDPQTRCIDPQAVARVLTEQTVAVVPVHLYGRPAPLRDLADACAGLEVPLVEDTAQAHGGMCDGRRLGTHGIAGSFSFYPTKNLGAMGDGGAVVTDDAAVAATIRSLRHHGSAPDDANVHEIPGRTERLDNLQAALLRLKLRRLDADNDERRSIARGYRERLAGLPVTLPPEDRAGQESVYHLFVIEVDERDRVRAALQNLGVSTGIHYPTPVHLQPAWQHLGHPAGSLPVTERLAGRVLSLPIFPGMQEDEVDRVGQALELALQ